MFLFESLPKIGIVIAIAIVPCKMLNGISAIEAATAAESAAALNSPLTIKTIKILYAKYPAIIIASLMRPAKIIIEVYFFV